MLFNDLSEVFLKLFQVFLVLTEDVVRLQIPTVVADATCVRILTDAVCVLFFLMETFRSSKDPLTLLCHFDLAAVGACTQLVNLLQDLSLIQG